MVPYVWYHMYGTMYMSHIYIYIDTYGTMTLIVTHIYIYMYTWMQRLLSKNADSPWLTGS